MIVHTVISFMAIVIVYYHVILIETYFGWCGTPVFSWLEHATVIGAVGSFLAIRQLIQIWRSSGAGAVFSRIIHLTLLGGFTLFVFRNYLSIDGVCIVCTITGVIAIGSVAAMIKNRKRKNVSVPDESVDETP